MFSSLGLTVLVLCFAVGTAIVVTLALRASGSSDSDPSVAQVLYNAEHPEKLQ